MRQLVNEPISRTIYYRVIHVWTEFEDISGQFSMMGSTVIVWHIGFCTESGLNIRMHSFPINIRVKCAQMLLGKCSRFVFDDSKCHLNLDDLVIIDMLNWRNQAARKTVNTNETKRMFGEEKGGKRTTISHLQHRPIWCMHAVHTNILHKAPIPINRQFLPFNQFCEKNEKKNCLPCFNCLVSIQSVQ